MRAMLSTRGLYFMLLTLWTLGHIYVGDTYSGIYAADMPSPEVTLTGRTLRLDSINATLEIPSKWTAWMAQFHDNIHLSAIALKDVRFADSEWDKEYAHITNAILPFEQCVAHLGGEGWGNKASSYLDVQMRVYLVGDTSAEVLARISHQVD